MSGNTPLINLALLTLSVILHGNTVSSTTEDVYCPQSCTCRHSQPHGELTTDCSNRGLSDFPSDVDARTVHLDLSKNALEHLPQDTFTRLRSLQTINISDNWISQIQPLTFKGLYLKSLDLSRNRLRVLAGDALSGLRGMTGCSASDPCVLNLQENGMQLVERNSLSWISGLSVLLGHSDRDLTVEAYAFYGAENNTLISIGNIPALTIEPRVFTNTQYLKRLVFFNTSLKPLHKFAFEGLNHVGEFVFDRCHFESIDEFTFSGITYTPEIGLSFRTNTGPQYSSVTPGGKVNISGSSLTLRTDTFRDTNLKYLIISNNHISQIESLSFRGLHGLSLLELSGNTIGIVHSEALGLLKNVEHVKLSQNDIGQLHDHVFKDSHTIDTLTLHLSPNSELTINANSFSGLRDVGVLEIIGSPGSSVSVLQDAFQDLGGVEMLRIANISMPYVEQHTFRGLSRVQTIRLEHCNISRIDSAAFGESRVTGAVANIELDEGNNLPCDCETNKLLREFEARFSEFTVTCYTSTGLPRVLTEESLDWPSCMPSSAATSWSWSNSTLPWLLSLCLSMLLTWKHSSS